jgi:ankyrin repeat protein
MLKVSKTVFALRGTPAVARISNARSFSSFKDKLAALKGLKAKLAGSDKIEEQMGVFFFEQIKAGQTDVVKAMLKQGMSPNTSIGKLTALHTAAHVGSDPITEALLEYKPAIDPIDSEGWTPLLMAATRSHSPVVKRLAASGASLTAATPSNGFCALHHAAMSGNTDSVTFLLAAGADPNARALDGSTPLHTAVYANKPAVLTMLLGAGANAAAENTPGMPALFIAAYQGQLACVNALLDAGAPADPVSSSLVVTPLAGAAAQGHGACVEALLRRGANASFIDGDGLTPAGWAKKQGHGAVEAILAAWKPAA